MKILLHMTAVRSARMGVEQFYCAIAVLLLLCHPSSSQNPYPDPNNQNAIGNVFYLTSKSDCSNQLKNIYGNEATVKGFALNSLDTGPISCTIRITSQGQFKGIQLQIYIIAMNIADCNTQVTIYDGQESQLLTSFDCHSKLYNNRLQLITSGDTATFMMSRQNPSNLNFDIEIRITPVRGVTNPNQPNSRFYFFDKFEQEAIVGMIGGFYGLIIIICIVIIIHRNLKYKGRLKRWETHQLSTMKTGTAFENRSQVSEPSHVWSMEMANKQGAASTYSRHSHADPYGKRLAEDESSVFDHDETFQQRKLMNARQERERHRDQTASENTSFTDRNDDDPDHFVEKVIRPRVRAGARDRREHRPPSFEEAMADRRHEHSSDEEEEEKESEESSDDDSTRKRKLSTEESSQSSGSDSQSESEDSGKDHSRKGRGAAARKGRWKPDKKSRRRPSLADEENSSLHSDARRNHPQQQQQQPPVQLAGMPYGGYPPGQFVPVMAGHPAYQPIQMVPNYPPPQYLDDHNSVTAQPLVQPTDPPVYSYLVRRGYTPLDPPNGRNSPASNASSQQSKPHLEEPDLPLHSGVEYMRR